MDTAAVNSYIRKNEKESTPDASEKNIQKNTPKDTEAMHVRDVNSRMIFKNRQLACQFLRDYSGVSLFSDIQPEDIEDMTDHYQALLGVEFESDTVKRVHVHSEGKEQEVYVVSLIEHKSAVDYDAAMQLLRYMTLIWYDYGKQQNALVEGASRRKSFRYPFIFPIVYYEGKAGWTADLHLSERIMGAEHFREYVPDFTYRVVSLQDYSNRELEEKGNGMGLVMMLNKIQSPEDYTRFFEEPGELISRIYENESEEIRRICREVLWSLFMKMNLETEEAQEMISRLEERGMGILFADAEKMDIQEERRLRAEAEQRLTDAEQNLTIAEQRLTSTEQDLTDTKQRLTDAEQDLTTTKQKLTDTRQRAADFACKALPLIISACKEKQMTREETLWSLQKEYGLTEEEALQAAERYWSEETE